MSSGEGDAVREIPVSAMPEEKPLYGFYSSINNNATTLSSATSNTLNGYYDSFGAWHNYQWTTTPSYSWTTTVYKYQVKCPVKSCKKYNWLELDKISPCVKCGTTLKAVSEQADFEIPVEA